LVPLGFSMFVDHSRLSNLVCALATGNAFVCVPGLPVALEGEGFADLNALQSR
jgi:hypothetical protein